MDYFHVILGRETGAVCEGMVCMKGGKFIDFLNNFSFSNNFRSMDRIYLSFIYEGWNFNSGNYLFTTDTK